MSTPHRPTPSNPAALRRERRAALAEVAQRRYAAAAQSRSSRLRTAQLTSQLTTATAQLEEARAALALGWSIGQLEYYQQQHAKGADLPKITNSPTLSPAVVSLIATRAELKKALAEAAQLRAALEAAHSDFVDIANNARLSPATLASQAAQSATRTAAALEPESFASKS